MLRRIALIQAGRAAGIPLEQHPRGARHAAVAAHAHPARLGAPLPRLAQRHRPPHRHASGTARPTHDVYRLRLPLHRRAATLLNPDDEAAALGAGAHYLRRDSRRARTT